MCLHIHVEARGQCCCSICKSFLFYYYYCDRYWHQTWSSLTGVDWLAIYLFLSSQFWGYRHRLLPHPTSVSVLGSLTWILMLIQQTPYWVTIPAPHCLCNAPFSLEYTEFPLSPIWIFQVCLYTLLCLFNQSDVIQRRVISHELVSDSQVLSPVLENTMANQACICSCKGMRWASQPLNIRVIVLREW